MKRAIKNFTAIFVAGAIAMSAAPFVFADEATGDENLGTVYYDENFDRFETGTLANMANGTNTSYDGFSFSCSERDNSGDEYRIWIDSDAENGNFLSMGITRHEANDRFVRVSLTDLVGAQFENDVIMSFRVKMSGSNPSLTISDASGNSTSYSCASSDSWESVTIAISDGTQYIVSRDAEGNLLSMTSASTSMGIPVTLSIPTGVGASNNPVSIDDLVIRDAVYEVDPNDLIDGTINSLDLSEDNAGVIPNGDMSYSVFDRSFRLPRINGMDAVWSAEQLLITEDQETEPVWEPTSYLSISGRTVTVNSTDGIEDYQIRLVVTLTYEDVVRDVYYNLDVQTPESIVNDMLDSLQLVDAASGSVINAEDGVYAVGNDLTLSTGNSYASVSWACYQQDENENWVASSIIDSTGAYSASDYDGQLRLVATATSSGYSDSREFMIQPQTAANIVDAQLDNVVLKNASDSSELALDEDGTYHITADLQLDTQVERASVAWQCQYLVERVQQEDEDGNPEFDENGDPIYVETWDSSSIVSGSGSFMPTDYTGELRLLATLSYNGATAEKAFPITSLNSVTEYIDPVIETAAAVSADDAEDVYPDIDNMGTINNDIILPTSAAIDNGSVRIDWEITSGEEYATLGSNGAVTIMTPDFNSHEVVLSATFTYVKNSQDIISKTVENCTFAVQFTEEDANSDDTALDKYKVRFDSANEDQFDIPSSTSSDLELIEEGMFGSSIKWASNAPSIISNSGDFTRPNSNRTVTLTASILSGAFSETKTFEVTARGKSTSGSGGGGGGGGSTSSTGSTSNIDTSGTIAQANPGTITTPQSSQEIVDELIQQREEAENRFTDIGGVSWARDAINGLYDAGIINGKTETTFAPNDNVTRAEFAKMLMGVFGLTSSGFTTSSFYDVPTDAWYFQSVESAYNLGIINGVSAGYFDPDANITRQDMAVMVMRAATVAGQSVTAVEEAITFADDASIADYAKEAVSTLQAAGIINGVSDTEFAPVSNATRAQAAQILYSFL